VKCKWCCTDRKSGNHLVCRSLDAVLGHLALIKLKDEWQLCRLFSDTLAEIYCDVLLDKVSREFDKSSAKVQPRNGFISSILSLMSVSTETRGWIML